MTFPAWKAKNIARELPSEWLATLRRMSGATFASPMYARDAKSQQILHYLGFCAGAPGSAVSGWDSVEWLTDMGQAVADAAQEDKT